MSAISTPQILSLKEEYIFCFSSFLIISFCNSCANCWFEIILLLIAPLEVLALADLFACAGADFLSKTF